MNRYANTISGRYLNNPDPELFDLDQVETAGDCDPLFELRPKLGEVRFVGYKEGHEVFVHRMTGDENERWKRTYYRVYEFDGADRVERSGYRRTIE